MKRMTITALIILIISCASFARKLVAEGKSFTAMGDFRIETSDQPVILDGVTLDTYTITYDNSATKLTIAIDKTKNCRRYITISDKLSVQYVCYGTHFGVEKLNRGYARSGWKTNDTNLNRTAYFHQKILTPGQQDPVTCLKLIGAFYPSLLNEGNPPA
ncbi:MAG TPA: hypothetical protein VK155_09545 [Bacteroidales bacterium]|nr:hypothetical protein [Bacteroidales bacterium]